MSALRDCLLRQLDIGWRLAGHHLTGLTVEACLWRPASRGLPVHPTAACGWRADWPESEGYELGPSSLAWLSWHMVFWWSMTLDHTFGDGSLAREDIAWAPDPAALRSRLSGLHDRWRRELERIDDAGLAATDRVRWPFADRPFADLAAWVNIELTKSAAEIGYVRFLYAAREGDVAAADG
jgi:hypothetical protein